MPDHAYICFVRCTPPGGTFAPCPARALDNCAKFCSFSLLLLLPSSSSSSLRVVGVYLCCCSNYISYFRLSLSMFWLCFFVVVFAALAVVVIFGVDELIAAM